MSRVTAGPRSQTTTYATPKPASRYVCVAEEYPNLSTSDPPVRAYGKLAGDGWTYYLQSVHVTIGRSGPALTHRAPKNKASVTDEINVDGIPASFSVETMRLLSNEPNLIPLPALINESSPAAQSAKRNSSALCAEAILSLDSHVGSVDVDLGPAKVISRQHAIIFYNFSRQRWELSVCGRNGVKIDNVHYPPQQKCIDLKSGNLLEMGGVQFLFLLPSSPTENNTPRKPRKKPTKKKQNAAITSNAAALDSEAPSQEEAPVTEILVSTPVVETQGFSQYSSSCSPNLQRKLPIDLSADLRPNLDFVLQSNIPAGSSQPNFRHFRRANSLPTTTSSVVNHDFIINAPFSVPKKSQQNATESTAVNYSPPEQLDDGRLEHQENQNPEINCAVDISVPLHGLQKIRTEINVASNLNSGENEDLARPDMSYSMLIAEAIRSSPAGQMSLTEIYTYVSSKYAYYRNKRCSWQNSIRHNLSMGSVFEKILRVPNDPSKGSFWRISAEYIDKDLSETRIARKRPASQSIARKTCRRKIDAPKSDTEHANGNYESENLNGVDKSLNIRSRDVLLTPQSKSQFQSDYTASTESGPYNFQTSPPACDKTPSESSDITNSTLTRSPSIQSQHSSVSKRRIPEIETNTSHILTGDETSSTSSGISCVLNQVGLPRSSRETPAHDLEKKSKPPSSSEANLIRKVDSCVESTPDIKADKTEEEKCRILQTNIMNALAAVYTMDRVIGRTNAEKNNPKPPISADSLTFMYTQYMTAFFEAIQSQQDNNGSDSRSTQYPGAPLILPPHLMKKALSGLLVYVAQRSKTLQKINGGTDDAQPTMRESANKEKVIEKILDVEPDSACKLMACNQTLVQHNPDSTSEIILKETGAKKASDADPVQAVGPTTANEVGMEPLSTANAVSLEVSNNLCSNFADEQQNKSASDMPSMMAIKSTKENKAQPLEQNLCEKSLPNNTVPPAENLVSATTAPSESIGISTKVELKPMASVVPAPGSAKLSLSERVMSLMPDVFYSFRNLDGFERSKPEPISRPRFTQDCRKKHDSNCALLKESIKRDYAQVKTANTQTQNNIPNHRASLANISPLQPQNFVTGHSCGRGSLPPDDASTETVLRPTRGSRSDQVDEPGIFSL